MNKNIYLSGLVIIQYVFFGYLALSGPVIAQSPAILSLEFIGLIIYVWAVATIGSQSFYISPKGSTLITSGPYAFLRHPMHLGILLVATSFLLTTPSVNRAVALTMLLMSTLVVIEVEESLLKKHHKKYSIYMNKTKKLVPLIY